MEEENKRIRKYARQQAKSQFRRVHTRKIDRGGSKTCNGSTWHQSSCFPL